MRLADHHLYFSESATGVPIQCLVPLGVAPKAAFRAAHRDYDGAECSLTAVVLGETLRRVLEAEKKPCSEEELMACEEVYKLYPRKIGRPAALKAIKKALAKVESKEWLLDRVKAYAAAVALWSEADKVFVPYGQKFFNDERYNDDPAMWKRVGKAAPKAPDHEAGF